MKKAERTLVIIKPDGIQRSLIGEIIRRYERTGLKLVGLKILIPTPEMIENHYSVDPDWKRAVGMKAIEAYRKKGEMPPTEDPMQASAKIISVLKKYMSAGPVIAMVWQGMNAVGVVRKITGSTEPLVSDVGTIRGDLTIDSYQIADADTRAVRNLVHTSGTIEDAAKEVGLWFQDEELVSYKLAHEAILCDVNLDGILE